MISAIVVSYNSGAPLVACVASLLNSSLPLKVIVSDNGSTDDSLDRLQAFFGGDERVSIVRNEKNLGFSKGCNRGLASATGDYILFINPDCAIRADTVARIYEVMEAHPHAGMAGCLVKNPDGSEQVGCRRFVPTPWRALVRVFRLNHLFSGSAHIRSFDMTIEPLPDHTVEVEAISGAFMFVRRSALEKVGPLDEGYFLHCEDLDWCMRFRQARYSILFVPSVEIMHLKGSSSASRPIFVEWHKHKGMVRFYRRFFRHQYPGGLMVLVISAVWIRFVLKSLWLSLSHSRRRSMRNRHPTYGPSSDVVRQTSMPLAQRNIIVIGATSQVGRFLLLRLVEAGYRVIAVSRDGAPGCADKLMVKNVFWLRADIGEPDTLMALPPAHALIHLAPLELLPLQLETLSAIGVKRVIAFSSSSRHSKIKSPVARERAFAQRLAASEDALAQLCYRREIHWTIFRPTLIYGLGLDRNVALIRRLVGTTSVFPLLGQGSGMRQPVHADDLAAACVAVLENPRTFNKAYDLSGGETLRYREMVSRIFSSLGRTPRFITIPLTVFGVAMKVLAFVPKYKDFNAAMAQRMNQDIVFSHDNAAQDFSYSPRHFIP